MVFMSPVSPVFHTVVTVRIGCKGKGEKDLRCALWFEKWEG